MGALKTTVTALAGKELFKKLVSDVYDFIVSFTGSRVKYWNTEKKIEKLYRQISKIRKVKTIWQIDKAVDLKSFYCDSHVLLNGKRQRIDKLDDFNTKENLIIQGIAGQGKSILLRYICSVELVLGN